MKDEYDEIKKLLINDIKAAQGLLDRQIAVRNFCDMFWILHEGYKLHEPETGESTGVADDTAQVVDDGIDW